MSDTWHEAWRGKRPPRMRFGFPLTGFLLHLPRDTIKEFRALARERNLSHDELLWQLIAEAKGEKKHGDTIY